MDLIFPKSVAAITKDNRENYRLMSILIGELRAQPDLTYRDILLPWVEHEVAGLKKPLQEPEEIVRRIDGYASKLTAYLSSRQTLEDSEWLWVSVFNAFTRNRSRLDAFAHGAFERLYRDDTLPSEQPDDGAASWSDLFEGAARVPFNVIDDSQQLRLIGEAHLGVYELVRFARSPKTSDADSETSDPHATSMKGTIVRGAMEISWPLRSSSYPVFRILYQSSQSEGPNDLFESKGVVVPTKDCIYLLGSENDLHNLAVLVLQNTVTNRSAPGEVKRRNSIRGIIVRRHSNHTIFAAKVFFRRTESSSIEQERANIGFKSPAEIHEFDNIRKYTLNTTNNRGESPISLD